MSAPVTQFDGFLSGGFEDINANRHAITTMKAAYQKNYAKHLPKDKAAVIVDVGCGTGTCLAWLQERGYVQATGIDPSKECVAFCKKKKFSVKQIKNTAAWAKKNSNKIDVIIMNDVIEHLPVKDIVPTMAALYHALKPGGKLIIKTNNVSAITGARMRYWDATHTTSFTEYSLGQVLHAAGCPTADMRGFHFAVNTPFRLIRRILQMIHHAWWKGVFWLEYTLPPKIVHEFFFAVVEKPKQKQ